MKWETITSSPVGEWGAQNLNVLLIYRLNQ